ncbi:MAG: pyridoxal-dependent decarboxylase, exosortase A system-associated [Xylophilus ampelinus]
MSTLPDTAPQAAAAPPQERHPAFAHFPVVDGELQAAGRPLSAWAAEIGRTPFYLYDRGAIDRRATQLRAALPPALGLHYAVKANPFPPLLAHMASRVDGFDVASGGELRRALDAGMPAHRISFAGPGKRPEELEQAVAAGILLHAESAREVGLLADAAARLGRPARVAVRVNPDFELKTAGMRMGGGPRPFGVDAEQVPALLREIGRLGLGFEGFHLYAGSQNLRAEALVETLEASYALALRLADAAPSPVTHLNLGGGFGIPYFPADRPLDLAPVAGALHRVAERARDEMPAARLCIELGRYLVGEAGVYVSRILDRKVSRGEVFLVADGGMHHHLAASGNFGQVVRRNYPVAIANRMRDDAPREVASVVGPLCTPLDILAARADLPRAEPGDLVAVMQSGAYGASASPAGFLGHPPASERLA